MVLCEGQKNEGLIPLNKNLWSISFILVMAGTGFILLAVFYFMIDVISWWNGSPFKYPGQSTIVIASPTTHIKLLSSLSHPHNTRSTRQYTLSLFTLTSPLSPLPSRTGMNSILVYVGSEVLQNYFPFSWEQQEDSHLELLFANIIGVSLWIGIAYYWYSIQFFVKI